MLPVRLASTDAGLRIALDMRPLTLVRLGPPRRRPTLNSTTSSSTKYLCDRTSRKERLRPWQTSRKEGVKSRCSFMYSTNDRSQSVKGTSLSPKDDEGFALPEAKAGVSRVISQGFFGLFRIY